MWPRTREDDLANQQSARRLRVVAGGLMVVGAAGLVAALLGGLLPRATALSWLPAPILALGGAALLREAASIQPTLDPRLPTVAELAADDPRRRLDRTTRRRIWLLAIGLSLAGPLFGGVVAAASRDHLPGLARLGLFAAIGYGAVFTALALFKRVLASRSWPN